MNLGWFDIITFSGWHLILYITWMPTVFLLCRSIVEHYLNHRNKYKSIPIYPQWLKMDYGKYSRSFYTSIGSSSSGAANWVPTGENKNYLLLVESKIKWLYCKKERPLSLLIENDIDNPQYNEYRVFSIAKEDKVKYYRELIVFERDKKDDLKYVMNHLEDFIMESLL